MSEDAGTGGDAGTGRGGKRPLERREQDILALERRGFAGPGAKERAIREELGLAP
uniref:DUF3263 domain-containing protein n=1 Tax=Streptomyces graminilatus TaxID=1464070 RepID=UPI000A3F5520